MVAWRNSDRRKAASKALRLGQPLFIDVPKAAAASVLAGCSLIAFLASFLTHSSTELGSVFLLLCAFAAWFVGNRFAIMLGAFIVVIQFLNGQLIRVSAANFDDWIDVAFRLSCAMIVVLMLGVARVALEIEWRHARLDPLTGALNRKAFFEATRSQANTGEPAVLIFADLDGLKGLNDRLGHEEGDRAICNFAHRVKRSIRKDDIFARVGGDEFVIYLNASNHEVGQIVADRLHQVINLRPEQEAGLKCSLGVLVLPTGSSSIDRELRHADSLMYDSKRSGAGYTIAFLSEDDHEKLVYLAAGIRPDDLEEASGPSSRTPIRENSRPRSDVNSMVA